MTIATLELAALSNDEQIAHLTRVARAAMRHWDLDDDGLTLLKYRENAVFALPGRAILRLHRPGYRSDQHIRSELAWIEALRRAGIATPAVLSTRGGDVIARAEADGFTARQCDLLGWVDGAPLGTLEGGVDLDEATLRRTYRTVGEIAARIHAHGRSWQRPAGFTRPAWDLATLIGEQPTFGNFWDLEQLEPAQLELLFRARDRARAELSALGRDDAIFGLTHGDLVPDNILSGPAGLRVVDFDDCGDSWYGFELATSIFPLQGSPAFEPARDAYVEGYATAGSVESLQLDAMPAFLMARALSYLGWPVGRPEIESGRNLAPMLVYLICEYAEIYLS